MVSAWPSHLDEVRALDDVIVSVRDSLQSIHILLRCDFIEFILYIMCINGPRQQIVIPCFQTVI